MHIYDYIIIGSGLTGLSIAKKISQETNNILILESEDKTGGSSRAASINSLTINNGLRFLPANEATTKAKEFVESLLNKTVALEASDNTIQTYEAGGFIPFVGFGEKPPEFYEQLSYFLQQKEHVLEVQPYQWIEELAVSLEDKIQKKSIVTRFGFEGLDGDKPKLTHVIVNGSKTLYAQNFIFAGPVKDLSLLVPDEVLNARAKAKLKKSKAWQSVGIDLFHTVSMEQKNLFLLNGTTDDDIGPCIGRFYGNFSQWTSFIDSESAEDTENIGFVLKKIKRQIKRAFPELSESITKERIVVSAPISGADLKVSANGTLPKVENLWLASPQLSPFQNLTGSLMQARFILSSLGFYTNAEFISTSSSSEDSALAEL